MGLLDRLFGKANKKKVVKTGDYKPRSEYNVMKNIRLEKNLKYENVELYKPVADGIYEDLSDKREDRFRMTISYELEDIESNNQFPLEDILDKYLMYVSDFFDDENIKGSGKYKLELGGFLDYMKKANEIIGKKIYNQDSTDNDGKIWTKMIIE